MAPRALESKAQFIARLRASVGDQPVGFGGAHFTHAVVHEAGVFRVRRLVLADEKVEAFRAQHGSFMPEDAEALREPTGEGSTRGALIELLQPAAWPLWRLAEKCCAPGGVLVSEP